MTEKILRTRQNCCRLCLAPDSECISILNSCAADKEPLVTKIQNCVGIKITSNDCLSLRICHACISYLNSWQSFKNRCQTSDIKQRNWLDDNNRQQVNDVTTNIIFGSSAAAPEDCQQQQDDYEGQSTLATSILDGISSLKKRKSLTVYPLPAMQIKVEPDTDEDYMMKNQHDESDELVDPTIFLERTEEEGDEPLLDSSGYAYTNDRSNIERAAAAAEVKEASCRACNLKFSTRANARRHERNLHPNLFDPASTSTLNQTISNTKSAPPALVAALELQRVSTNWESTKRMTQQKYRKEVVNAFNNNGSGGFDYAEPDKYQHLLTDEKIVFLQQNEEFLQQYQKMTCRCCNKFYATYKNFMAHMRKKYSTLPRNLCFNCLKLNDSKALFISHLKRRNCINLFKVLNALMAKKPGFADAVTATAAAAPEKLRAKELLVNKIYECKLCPKHYRLKLEFRSHVYEDHTDDLKKDIAQTQCSFCSLQIEDPAERKRHYNNMDCIVTLRCVTCNSKFDNHQKFLDHVYDKHLSGFGETVQPQYRQQMMGSGEHFSVKKPSLGIGGTSSADESRSSLHATASSSQPKSQYFSRMPQACPICGQQYNNYNNVLRHMESKHPDQLPQTYKCVKCGIGYPRLSNLREHMVTAHAADKARHTGFEYIVNADAVKIADGSAANVYSGRYDYVMKDLMSITNGGIVAEEDENENGSAQKKSRLDNNSSTSGNMYSSLKECPICNAVFSNNIGLSNHMRSHTAAAQSAAAVAIAGCRGIPSSLTITATSTATSTPKTKQTIVQHQTPAQQAIFRRSLEQAADRRFRRMRCRICQRRFSSKKSYRFHMFNDHQIRNVQFIKCKLCDAEFAYEKGLKVHMFKIHNTLLKDEMIIKQYECDICSIVYRMEEQLLQHKKTIHGNENIQAIDFTEQPIGTEMDLAGADRSGISTPASSFCVGTDRSGLDNSGLGLSPLYWYQCKYCPSNFNTNKKLAIHINSHDEFDSNDYSCKDCGNVYSGRKSLWVHRYKKHPQIAEPSECVLCKKVFFDSQMLENHTPTCNRKPITVTGALAEPVGGQFYKHKTGDDEEDIEHSHDGDSAMTPAKALTTGVGDIKISNLKIKLPEVACTMCGQRFTDQDLFAKHIHLHEMELYTDNPLAAMFDTGPADPNQFFLDRVNDNGEYACDLCQKTFTQMTALKMHRKWHFRGDNKQNQTEAEPNPNMSATLLSKTQTQTSHQHPLGLQAVGLMPCNPHSPSKSLKRKRELKCEYCPTTFISNNNLRRHIYELHKNEIGNLPVAPKIEIDKNLCCRRCDIKMATKEEWIEHKVADARIMKPFGPFQWGCDLCGAYVSRKEKLINHIHNHLKENVITSVEKKKQLENEEKYNEKNFAKNADQEDDDQDNEYVVLVKDEYEEDALDDEEDGDDEEVDTCINAYYEEEDFGEDMADEVVNVNENANDGQNDDDDEEDDDGDGVEDEEDTDCETNDTRGGKAAPELPTAVRNSNNTTEAEDSPPYVDEDDEDEEVEEAQETEHAEEDEEEEADSINSEYVDEIKLSPPIAKTRFACDLCQVFFDSQQELQKHVKLHFLNGPGSVSLTEIKQKSTNKSRSSSSSDVVSASSS